MATIKLGKCLMPAACLFYSPSAASWTDSPADSMSSPTPSSVAQPAERVKTNSALSAMVIKFLNVFFTWSSRLIVNAVSLSAILNLRRLSLQRAGS